MHQVQKPLCEHIVVVHAPPLPNMAVNKIIRTQKFCYHKTLTVLYLGILLVTERKQNVNRKLQ